MECAATKASTIQATPQLSPESFQEAGHEGRLLLLPHHPRPPHGHPTRASLSISPSPALKALILPLLRSHVSVSTPFLWLKTVKNWEAVEILDSPCKLTKLPVTVSWRLADDTAVLGQRQGTYHTQQGKEWEHRVCPGSLLPPRPTRQTWGGAQVYAAQAVGSH